MQVCKLKISMKETYFPDSECLIFRQMHFTIFEEIYPQMCVLMQVT